MYEHINDPLVRRLRGLAIAVVASATSAALPAHGEFSENIILVPPVALLEIAAEWRGGFARGRVPYGAAQTRL